MARSLANKTNVQAPDSDYPYGRIKDDSGASDGTPVDENAYGDMHQFFERLMNQAGVAHNEQPDNDYSGFQFFEALEAWLLANKKVLGFASDNTIKYRRKVIEIGNWNMNQSAGGAVSVNIAHGLTLSKIRSVSVLIRRDDDAQYVDYASFIGTSGGIQVLASDIQLGSGAAGPFDNTSYDTASAFNRGWITIDYEV